MNQAEAIVFSDTIQRGEINPLARKFVDGSTATLAVGAPEKVAQIGTENAEMRAFFDSVFDTMGLTSDEPMHLEMRAKLLNTIRISEVSDFDSMKDALIIARDEFETGAGRLEGAPLARNQFDDLALAAVDYKKGITREAVSPDEASEIRTSVHDAMRDLVTKIAQENPGKRADEVAEIVRDTLAGYSGDAAVKEIRLAYQLSSQ